ncbi:chitinase-3 protein 1 [Biomphalaria glabrata]|nr:chitinase-3 protein 1 [Biomphalaria glabrata]
MGIETMRSSTYLVLVILIVCAYTTEANQSSFCNIKASGLYADPKDCSKFYSCLDSITFQLLCPTGLYFNEVHKVCDWPVNVQCPKAPQVDSTTTVTSVFSSSVLLSALTTLPERSTRTDADVTVSWTAPTTDTITSSSLYTNIGSVSTEAQTINYTKTAHGDQAVTTTMSGLIVPSLIFCSDKRDSLYADPMDCGGFYQCHRGYTYHFQCGQGLLFNALYQYCDWPYNVKCGNQQTGQSETRVETNFQYSSSTVKTGPWSTSSAPRASGSSSPGCGKIVCYVSNWSKYRFGDGKFTVDNVNPNLCTHVIYSFVKLSGNRLVPIELTDEPSEGDVGNFARITRLKMLNPKLKVLLAVGGWSSSSTDFSLMASSKESREEFVTTTVQFLRQRNFDGLDFDWEYPANEAEKELLTLLCEKIRNAFELESQGESRLLLTVAVSAGKWTIDTAYNIPRMSTAVDFFNLMTYDLHGPWEQKTGHHSPLLPGSWEQSYEAYLNIDWVVKYWVSQGAPKAKLVIGSPLYGRTFTLADMSNTGVMSPTFGGGSPGPYTNEAGFLSYYEVCQRRGGQAHEYVIESQKAPYMVYGNQWIGYDNQVSLREKVRYIRQNNYGGIMLWELSFDDFNGSFCREGKFPLLTAINDECYN